MFRFSIHIFLITLFVFTPTLRANKTCARLWNRIAGDAAKFTSASHKSSNGDTRLSELIELAQLLNQQVHVIDGEIRDVGELEETPTFNYFSPNPIELSESDIPATSLNNLREIVNQVEIPENISNLLNDLNHEFAGVKVGPHGAPRQLPVEQKKLSFIQTMIAEPLSRLASGFVLDDVADTDSRGPRYEKRKQFNQLAEILRNAHLGSSTYLEATTRYTLQNEVGVYEQIYDRAVRELFTEFRDLPKIFKKRLLKLIVDPEPSLIQKAEMNADPDPSNHFGWYLGPPSWEMNYTESESNEGDLAGVIAVNSFLGGLVKYLPVYMLGHNSPSNSADLKWFTIFKSEIESKFRSTVDVYNIPMSVLEVVKSPKSGMFSNNNVPEDRPSSFETPHVVPHATIILPPELRSLDPEKKVKYILSQLKTSSQATEPNNDGNSADPVEPAIVIRYPNAKTLDSAQQALRAIVARDFLKQKGKRSLKAGLTDLRELEKYYTLNGPSSSKNAPAQHRAQMDSIQQEKSIINKLLEERTSFLSEHHYEHQGRVSDDLDYFDLSDDGNLMVYYSHVRAKLIDLTPGKSTQWLESSENWFNADIFEQKYRLQAGSFSSDNQRLITTTEITYHHPQYMIDAQGAPIKIWNLAKKKLELSIYGLKGKPARTALSPDGKQIAITFENDPNRIEIWNVSKSPFHNTKNTLLFPVKGRRLAGWNLSNKIIDIVYSSTTKGSEPKLHALCEDGSVRVVGVEKGESIYRTKKALTPLQFIKRTPDSLEVLSGNYNEGFLEDVSSGTGLYIWDSNLIDSVPELKDKVIHWETDRNRFHRPPRLRLSRDASTLILGLFNDNDWFRLVSRPKSY